MALQVLDLFGNPMPDAGECSRLSDAVRSLLAPFTQRPTIASRCPSGGPAASREGAAAAGSHPNPHTPSRHSPICSSTAAAPARRPLSSFDQSVLGAYGYGFANDPAREAQEQQHSLPLPSKIPRVCTDDRIDNSNNTNRSTAPLQKGASPIPTSIPIRPARTSYSSASIAPVVGSIATAAAAAVEHSPLELLERQPPPLFLLCSEVIANFGLWCALHIIFYCCFFF